jgi:hypothetical protein
MHLLVARSVLKPDESRYFVSNAGPQTRLETLLVVAFARWHVERCFEDEKTELGFDHYEGRNYIGLLRHQALTAVTHLFLARIREQWRGENSELTVCQLRTAAAALVQAWWLGRKTAARLLEHTAAKISYQQQQNAKARQPHETYTTTTSRAGHTTHRLAALAMA